MDTETKMNTVIFISGMHRSGTSHVAGLVKRMEIDFVGDLLPPNDDNPEGYWENSHVVSINNAVLANFGLSWRSLELDLGRLQTEPPKHLQSDIDKALQSLVERSGPLLAVKDPRFCLLLSHWLASAERLGLKASVLGVIRSPTGVARSLFRRTGDQRFAAAGVASPTHSFVLWTLYNLSLERQSRAARREFIDYDRLRAMTEEAQVRVTAETVSRLLERPIAPENPNGDGPAEAVVALAPKDGTPSLRLAYKVHAAIHSGQPEKAQSQGLDDLTELTMSVTGTLPARSHFSYDGIEVARVEGDIGQALDQPKYTDRPLRIAFVSGAPDSKGHIYRVENRIEGLIGSAHVVFRQPHGSVRARDLAQFADVVVLFRVPWTPWVGELLLACRSTGTRTVLDIDDLTFEENIISDNHIAYLERQPGAIRDEWRERAGRYRQVMREVDAVWTPTLTLASRAAAYARCALVLPNGLSHARLRDAANAIDQRQASVDTHVRIGYASGTPSHQRDFACIEKPLAQVLAHRPDCLLTLVGHVAISPDGPLSRFSERIEIRSEVRFNELPYELARFDINLAPLEAENPFCDCKSELKYFEAGIVEVPTIASPTPPFSALLSPAAGLVCPSSDDEWAAALIELAGAPSKRRALGQLARSHALFAFGPDKQRDDLLMTLDRTRTAGL